MIPLSPSFPPWTKTNPSPRPTGALGIVGLGIVGLAIVARATEEREIGVLAIGALGIEGQATGAPVIAGLATVGPGTGGLATVAQGIAGLATGAAATIATRASCYCSAAFLASIRQSGLVLRYRSNWKHTSPRSLVKFTGS